jgi:hypothetical protein
MVRRGIIIMAYVMKGKGNEVFFSLAYNFIISLTLHGHISTQLFYVLDGL